MKNSDEEISSALKDIQNRLTALEDQLDIEAGHFMDLEALANDIQKKAALNADIKTKSEPPIKTAKTIEEAIKMAQMQMKNETEKNDRASQIARFKEAGFSENDAVWLADKIDDIRIDSLYEGWENARRNYLKEKSKRKSGMEELKERLGPDGYEKYFKALGTSASVIVEGVMEKSPADLAGLKKGDEIISYNGERICYNLELSEVTVRGELGEPVILEIIRDGQKIKIPMARGPLGIVTDWGAGVLISVEQVEGKK
ncbi:MAG: PDZ domain-containing protein [Deltaproteobacteria bacterium]|nr:PDZ domain-containing protein [Deltaproteobacteria bacterium]